VHAGYDGFVFPDVLDDIESANDIESVRQKQPASVHLDQLDALAMALASEPETLAVQLAPGNPAVDAVSECGQDKARPATDLEHMAGADIEVPEQPLDEMVSLLEPEVTILELDELFE
jgi:hypothetical protein